MTNRLDTPAPIVLFVYCRPEHTRRTVQSLLRNPLSSLSDLIIYSDGPRQPELQPRVEAVRQYCRTLQGFRSVILHEQPRNRGLASSIIGGVTETLQRYDQIIVLEDDLEVAPGFLQYMNDGLQMYRLDQSVASIHGYCYPVPERLPETFFLRGADCWGWATWGRAWQLFQPDGRLLLQQLQKSAQTKVFDLDGTCNFTQMLIDQIAGHNDSWAIRWHAACFLADRLTLYPGKSLVTNTGVDGSGTHCGADQWLANATGSLNPGVSVTRLELHEDVMARAAISRYLAKAGRQNASKSNVFLRLWNRIRRL